MAPFLHYEAIYAAKDPQEIAARCAIQFDSRIGCFRVRVMGRDYLAPHPGFKLLGGEGAGVPAGADTPVAADASTVAYTGTGAVAGVSAVAGAAACADKPASAGAPVVVGASTAACAETGTVAGVPANAGASGMERLLVLRYLCEGAHEPWRGGMVAYSEIPWGGVYASNFQGRCVRRLAREFGSDAAGLADIMRGEARLEAERVKPGDVGVRFAFMPGLYMAFAIWEGDDEFEPSAQILFSDNFPAAFTAEDIAVAAEVALSRLRAMKSARQVSRR
ncbi:MAG: DUF3786 domain-containing protein [Clostridiales bacterium]|nr:DUF3786 domain-containing protein [Clostridiales bacterium]